MFSSIAYKVARTAFSTLPKLLPIKSSYPEPFARNLSIAAIKSNSIQGLSISSKFNQFPLSKPALSVPALNFQQNRSVTKFSLKNGKRKTVKAVLKRFKRLNWGIWIRTHCGRHKKLFKKAPALRRRLKQHVFVNSTQSWLLDKMVTKFWRKPKYYIDDPYEQYQKRGEFFGKSKAL